MASHQPIDQLTDEQLMKLYQQGHHGAFKCLYERHSGKVYGFLMSRIKNKEKVAEIYQEVFIKLHKSKNLYDVQLPVLPWIFTITKSVMMDELRKNKDIPISDNYDLDKLPTPEESSLDNSAKATEALNKLPDQQKTALQMRYMNDDTFDEIAERLSVSPVNARQIISRGLKRLRQLIGEEGS